MVALAATFALVVSSASFGPAGVVSIAAMVPAAFLLTEMFVAQLDASMSMRRPLGRLLRGNLGMQAPLLLAQWSASLLLIATFRLMEVWSLVPVVALLLLMRQSYALLLEIRETYRTTVEVLVEAAESQDATTRGHAERSESAARAIAMRVGLPSTQVELISYAALLHDVDALGAYTDVMDSSRHRIGRSSMVFEGVEFLANVLPILRVCDGRCTKEDDYSRDEFMAAIIVGLASDADVAGNPEAVSAYRESAVSRFSQLVPADVKAAAVSAALSLGYKIPAVQ
jgi:hypothetical protein